MLAISRWSWAGERRITFDRPFAGLAGVTLYGYGGWQWTTRNGHQYRTDEYGCGLWTWMEGRGEWVQEQGTCQFSLPADRARTVRILRRAGYDLAEAA